ncbi:MAG: PKD domain-containing protein [Parcubacteria group bacterium]|nr:PKD domain-containing protein [Parcubacteria group bacterium]
MNPGETKNFSISMENTGNTRWYHPIVYALTQTTSGININLTSPTSQHCQTYMSWLPVCFGKYPGDVMDWTFNLTAPSSVGVYSFQMRMSHAAGEEYLKPDGTTCPAPSSSVLFGQTLSTTINVVQPDQAPIGYLDAANCDIIGGWTFDPDTPNDSINVEIWDGQKGAGGVLVASGLTTGLRQDVNDAYGITGNHGYTFTTPPSLKNGVNHSVYAYGINSNPSGSDGLLGNSPTSVLCPIVDLKVKKKGESDSSYTDGPLSVSFNSKVTLKWTPANSSSCTASGDWSGSKSTSGGTEDQGPLNQIKSYNFNIACTGISSGQANDSVRVDVGVPSPTASNITVTQPNYCVSGPAATTGWDYSDPSGSPQSAYQVQIDDQGSFATPEWDSGKVFCESCRANSTPQGYLVFNRTYKARVKVWNQNDVSSLWAESGSFKTPNQAYPQVDFTFTPANPQRTQPIQFTDQTVFYDSNPNNRSWSWIFGDGGSSTQQNPVKAYANNGIYNVTLTATDASGQSCPVTKPVNVQEANPIWKEINPGG